MKKIVVLVCIAAMLAAASIVAATNEGENNEEIVLCLYEHRTLEMPDLFPSTAIVIDVLETPIGPMIENPVPSCYILPVIDAPVSVGTIDMSGNMISIPIDFVSPNTPIIIDGFCDNNLTNLFSFLFFINIPFEMNKE